MPDADILVKIFEQDLETFFSSEVKAAFATYSSIYEEFPQTGELYRKFWFEKEMTRYETQFENYRKSNPPKKAFCQYLLDLMKEKGMQRNDVLAKSQLNMNTFNSLILGRRKPQKDQIIVLAFALELTFEESVRLLAVAGQALSEHISRDVVLLFALRELDNKKSSMSLEIVDHLLRKYKHAPILIDVL